MKGRLVLLAHPRGHHARRARGGPRRSVLIDLGPSGPDKVSHDVAGALRLARRACSRPARWRPPTFALALREGRGACIRPTTQAAPAMSPFMSSMPPAGLIEMPPVSNTTPLPMKATGLSFLAPPFQRMTATRAGRSEPLRDAEQRAHADLGELLLVEDLHLDAELLELFGLVRELDGAEHVRRLVHEVAGDGDARRRGLRGSWRPSSPRSDRRSRTPACRPSPRRSRRRTHRTWRSCPTPCLFLAFFDLLAVEGVGAHTGAERHLGDLGRHPPPGRGSRRSPSPRARRSCRRRSRPASPSRSRRDPFSPPRPTTTSRSIERPAGAASDIALLSLPLKRSDFAARAISPTASPSTSLAVGPGSRSSETKTTRSPLSGIAGDWNSILNASAMGTFVGMVGARGPGPARFGRFTRQVSRCRSRYKGRSERRVAPGAQRPVFTRVQGARDEALSAHVVGGVDEQVLDRGVARVDARVAEHLRIDELLRRRGCPRRRPRSSPFAGGDLGAPSCSS